jgi:hypothetical protein
MQVDRLRSANTLILSTPFVGYFTTLPFRAMWQTNVNNQSRVTINQAMIVGLGAAFDGKNGNQAGALPGLDASHSVPNSPCYSCHRNLDPMRMFYQHDLDNYGAPQTDSNITSIVPTFVFNTAPVQGHSLYDLGSLIAQNSGFGPAWVQKLCVWANSAPCSTTDPEFIRLTNLFVQSNYSWNTLVENLMVSPLITYAAPTATANSTGGLASLSRRNHLCHTLNTRLGLTDLCQQQDQYGSTTGSVLTTSLPADTVLRGSVHPAAPTATTMAFRTSAENLCLTAVSEAVKASSVPQLGQSDPNVLVDFLVSGLMGLSPKESNTPSSLLLTHYQQALAAATVNPTMDYSAPDAAMRSTFVVACLTPYVTAIGF